jgi:hypothetical protein
MGIENFIETLYLPEDALDLCQGKLRNRKALEYSLLDDKDVLDAAEILILLNDANNLCSKADVMERAMSYGWEPVNIHSWDTLPVAQTPKQPDRSARHLWRNILTETAKFLLRMIPKEE